MSDWTPRGTQQINLRAGELLPDLEARSGTHGNTLTSIVRRDLNRYYEALRRELPLFSVPEASLIVDAMNGTIMEPHSIGLLWGNVQDGIRLEHLDEKWGVDGTKLVSALQHYPYAPSLAIVDACERFWNRVSEGVEETHEERLRAVGLIP